MKNDKKQSDKFPVREGQKNNSILDDKNPPAKNKYPQPELKDKQVKNQPEFTEEQPNRKTTGNTNK